MQIAIGNVLKVLIRYAYRRGGVFYYQRGVPKDLLSRYPSSPIKINLKTSDPIKAAREVDRLNLQYEGEWALLRADPSSTPAAARAQAPALVASYGIDPKNPTADDTALDLFVEGLQKKHEQYAGGDEDRYSEAIFSDYLTPTEIAAVQLITGENKIHLSDVLAFYLGHKTKKSKGLRFRRNAERNMGYLISFMGDKELVKVTRDDAWNFIDWRLTTGGVKTTSVGREIASIRAMFSTYIREKELEQRITNKFASLDIPDLGKDAVQRVPFRDSERHTLESLCRSTDDDIRWLLSLIIDTGARLSEIAGLALADIHLNDEDAPHIDIKIQPWRDIKKDKLTERIIPLVGISLWAAERITANAKPGQLYAFPRYCDGSTTRGASASGTINGWMRSKGLDHTAHELRHTMADRLREIECPAEVADSIGGWNGAGSSERKKYGKGYLLRLLHPWLLKCCTENK